MKTTVISALAIIMLISAIAPNVMASQGYWSASDSYPPEGLKKYHLFLVGTYPSSKFSGAELVNQNLTVCLDFTSDWFNPKPVVCHPIKESEIPLKNDSVIDAGFFVASDKLNETNANICVHVGYRNLYSCSHSDRGGTEPMFYIKLFYDLSDTDMIYQEARAYDYCIHDHPEDDLNWCVRQVT